MRSLLVALPFSLIACTTAEVDELAGEVPADDVVDGKADSAADGAYTYFSIKSDTRKCVSPHCGGFHLARVNRTTTKCHDGSTSDSCYTPELDFSEANLSQAMVDKLRLAASAAVFDGVGVKALVRGRFAKKSLGPVAPELGRFIVTEAWVAQSDSVSDGVFVKAFDNGIRCITAPCFSVTEKGLNTSRSASISDIDFAPAGLTDTQLGEIGSQMFEPSGLIIAGDRFTTGSGSRKGKGRTATAVYVRLADAAVCAGNEVKGPSTFVDSTDGKQCEVPETHCLTTDSNACPQLTPLPPTFCSDGDVRTGAPNYLTSSDGMECQLPSIHCVTKDHTACPQLSPLPPNFCSDGTIVRGPSHFISSADGKECEMPSIHCVTKDAAACPAN